MINNGIFTTHFLNITEYSYTKFTTLHSNKIKQNKAITNISRRENNLWAS